MFNLSSFVVALGQNQQTISVLSAFAAAGFQIHTATLREHRGQSHVHMGALYKGRSTEQAHALSRALAACGK